MTKIITLLFFAMIYLFPLNGQVQSNFADRLIIGSSLTYIWDFSQTTQASPTPKYNEYTWNNNIALRLSRNMYFGLSYLNIYTNGSIIQRNQNKWNHYSIIGLFTQYDLEDTFRRIAKLPQHERTSYRRAFIEISGNLGDYCTCGQEDPYRHKNLFYYGIGAGYEFPIINSVYLDLSFMSYYLTIKNTDKYAYTQYVIGINYIFEKKV